VLRLPFNFQGFLQHLVTGGHNFAVHLETTLRDDEAGKFRGKVNIGLLQRTFVDSAEIFCSGNAFLGRPRKYPARLRRENGSKSSSAGLGNGIRGWPVYGGCGGAFSTA
jgi:hypothetical protein